MDSIGRIYSPESFQRTFEISRETLDRLKTYAQLLVRWQKTINLVAPSTLGDLWHRHFADSAQLWRYRPPEARVWLDIGSGAGFPGLVLAILGAEAGATHHILIESDSRKAAFLREVGRETGITVDILGMRIENPQTCAKVSAVDCITARALAPLPRLLEMSAPYFSPSTLGLFLKGRDGAAEIEQAAESWRFAYELKPSVTDRDARVVLLKALKPKRED
jgi:16S rRNA (guanine527-N7)-methyltransferase